MAQQQKKSFPEQVGWLLWALAGSLIAYNYYALGLPGTAVLQSLGSWAGLLTTLLGGVAGIIAYHLNRIV
jgi:hypothetical protein